MEKAYYAGPANDIDEYLVYDGNGNIFAKFWHTDPFSAEDCAEMTARAINCHTVLLAALKRSEQYLYVAIIDGRKQKLNEETIAIAERDLAMVQDAIKAAEPA